MRTTTGSSYVLTALRAVVGVVWLRAGLSKIESGHFVAGMGKTLAAFASKNPNGWYREFLTGFAIPNHQLFGYMTMFGELLVGIGLIASAAYVLVRGDAGARGLVGLATAGALFGGALMSWNYWLASGWTSPSSETVNYTLGLIQVVLLAGAVATLIVARRTTSRVTPRHAYQAVA